jgi:hypothetical protein
MVTLTRQNARALAEERITNNDQFEGADYEVARDPLEELIAEEDEAEAERMPLSATAARNAATTNPPKCHTFRNPAMSTQRKLSLSPYGKALLGASIDSFIKMQQMPDTGQYENKNPNRDKFYTMLLERHGTDLKPTFQALCDSLPARSSSKYLITLSELLLKNAMFSAMIDRQLAIRADEGVVSDEVFAHLTDNRAADETAPPGLEKTDIELRGVNFPLHDQTHLVCERVEQELEDLRIYLEELCTAYGASLKNRGGESIRMAFFTGDESTAYHRYNNSAAAAIDAFKVIQDRKSMKRKAEDEAALANAAEKLKAALA